MPRVLMGRRNDKYQNLRLLFKGAVETDKKDPEDIGLAIGVCGKTARKYLKSPGSVPLETILKLGRYLGIPIDQLRDSIKY